MSNAKKGKTIGRFIFGCLFVVCVVGCDNQLANVKDHQADELSGTSRTVTTAVETAIDLKKAFSLAYDEIDGDGNLQDDFKLTVEHDANGWTFLFTFLPEAPGKFYVFAVSKNGDVEGGPGF